MTSVTMQRDLVVNLKKEIHLNVGILSKLRSMSADLTRHIFKENALEKLTQNIFNHLSYYLVHIIDPPVAEKFSWPLYDSKTERTFRSQLSTFINNYSNKGLLSPVMSSYLVNPACYKVTMLIFQMSQLAVQRTLASKMVKDSQKVLYDEMTNKYKNNSDSFLEDIERETNAMSWKFSNYLRKREAMEKIAGLFSDRIVTMEQSLASSKAQEMLDSFVDKYLSRTSLDNGSKAEIMKIKNVKQHSAYFDWWLEYFDKCIMEIESKWDEKISPFLRTCSSTRTNTEALISRNTGEADRNSFMIEYNHATDEICTTELQAQVNSQQKYILKNIVMNERLSFPNLIRGFLIAICYVLKNTEIGDEIYKFNEYLEIGHRNFKEIILAMAAVNERIVAAEKKIEPSPVLFSQLTAVKEFEIPPLPDLSDLKANRENFTQVMFNTFTPLSISKNQFNLNRKANSFSFIKPQLKATITPFHQPPRDDFSRSVISCRISSYDHNISHNIHNISVIPQSNNRGNETIAECSAGFTKQQIMRLLSTKKSSSSKKFKHKTERPDINIVKGGLFNDSTLSNDSNGLFRSYSSPNLFENREKRGLTKGDKRKLSVMQEDVQSILEVSGILALEKDDSFGSAHSNRSLRPDDSRNSKKLSDSLSLPVIGIRSEDNEKINKILSSIEIDLNKEISDNFSQVQTEFIEPRKSYDSKEESKTETPKVNGKLQKKTNSLEKIINRFKKIRATVINTENADEEYEIKTIVEERERDENVEMFTANKILLPDLLSPSCNVLNFKSTDYMDQFCMDLDDFEGRKPRQSLGTALGVDETFLDQFDLVD